jgi:hypothetical protein
MQFGEHPSVLLIFLFSIHASTSPWEILLSSPRSQSEFAERLSAITSDKVVCCCMKICQDMRVFTRFLGVSFNMVNTCAWENCTSDSRYLKRIFGEMFIPVSYRKLSCNACVRQRWQSKTDSLMFGCFKGKLIKFVIDTRIYIFWL